MTFRPPWPTSLAGRTLLLLLATMLIVYVGAIVTYRSLVESAVERGRLAQVAGRLETTINELSALPVPERALAARRLSSASFRVLWGNTSLVDDATAGDPDLVRLREQLTRLVPKLAGRDVHLRWDEQAAGGAHHVLLGAAPMADGSYVVFSAAMIPTIVPPLQGSLLAAALMFGSVVVVAVFLLHTINAPLRRLAKAADRYGKDGARMLPERGPKEIVQAERAFNAMQRRIERLIADRTQALVAVSHDLRTPIARLRLCSGLLTDKDSQAEIEHDLAEMEAMVESTLAYLRGENDTEPPRLTDLGSLLMTLVNAATDAGHVASLAGSAHSVLMVRAVSVKRAFANLIDNALTYGGCARIAIHQEPDGPSITIDDDGPAFRMPTWSTRSNLFAGSMPPAIGAPAASDLA
ncbi:MAG: HAMP domain-containing protein [Bradyrhizobium sp.]